MPRGSYVVLACLLLAIGCSEKARNPIQVGEGAIVVDNQTGQEWRNVIITVNEHFRGGARTLAPGGRLNAPLSQFQTGHGQRFTPDRTMVMTVIVTATDAAGQPVRLEWDVRGKKRNP
jgi:hypothetical protein